MVLPIYVYGHPVLRKVAKDISPDYEGFDTLKANLWETMYKTDGIGLAAPQVGKSIRVFVIDADALKEEFPEVEGFKKIFINAHIVEEVGEEWAFNEGCLSVPNIREDVKRKSQITINYLDEDWNEQTETYDGVIARIIQHEYDHLDGKLLTDRISPFKRKLLKSKLTAISKGKIRINYRIVTPK